MAGGRQRGSKSRLGQSKVTHDSLSFLLWSAGSLYVCSAGSKLFFPQNYSVWASQLFNNSMSWKTAASSQKHELILSSGNNDVHTQHRLSVALFSKKNILCCDVESRSFQLLSTILLYPEIWMANKDEAAWLQLQRPTTPVKLNAAPKPPVTDKLTVFHIPQRVIH